jgi:ribosomal protein S18 acetylase RimI-like enzyme
MRTSFTTSLATRADIKLMATLLQTLLLQEADFTPNINLQEEGLRLIIENKEIGQLLVLKDKQVVVGMVNLLFTISTALGGKVAILEDVILLPEYRNQGFGSKLIEAAIQFAKDNDCKRITLLTDSDNEMAHAFYKKHGFVKSGMIPFRLML